MFKCFINVFTKANIPQTAKFMCITFPLCSSRNTSMWTRFIYRQERKNKHLQNCDKISLTMKTKEFQVLATYILGTLSKP